MRWIAVGLWIASTGCSSPSVIMIGSRPTGAHAFRNNKHLGVTPLAVEATGYVTLVAPGHLPTAVDLSEGSHEVELPPSSREHAPSVQRADPRAWSLLGHAVDAARANDCATTIEIGTRLHALAPELHARVYVRELAIATCREAAR